MLLSKSPAGGDTGVASRQKGKFRERLIHEFRQFVGMFIYLWAMFGLMMLHESVVLARYDIPFTRWGFALITALVLAKVMLVMEELRVVRGLDDKPLIYPILCKSVVFAIVFIAFYVAEEIAGGLFRGNALRESVPTIGGGTPQGMLAIGLIATLALMPYFAFKEISDALGQDEMHALLFARGRRRTSKDEIGARS